MSDGENPTAQDAEEVYVSYMIVSINNTQYAFRSEQIQEIVQEAKVYALPFVPRYVEGIINIRGMAYTVIHPLMMLKKIDEAIDDGIFLVIRRSDDRFCLHISMTDTFFSVPEKDAEEKRLLYQGKQIEIIDSDIIEKKLRSDLEK